MQISLGHGIRSGDIVRDRLLGYGVGEVLDVHWQFERQNGRDRVREIAYIRFPDAPGCCVVSVRSVLDIDLVDPVAVPNA
jgi:hypothetical protein